MERVTDVLTPASDHSYRVITIKSSDLPWITVSWSEEFRMYFEYAGDEYLEGDEVAVLAQVLDTY